MSTHNGLSNRSPLKQSTLRQAFAETVSELRAGASDQDFADEWGACAGTVNNVQNQRHDLSSMLFLKLGERFGARGVNKALALIGLIAAPRESVILDYGKVPLELARALPIVMELLSDGDLSADDMRKLEEAGIAESFIKLGDDLRHRRGNLKAVG